MDWVQFILFLALISLLIKPFGIYLSQVLDPHAKTCFDRVLKPLESRLYQWTGVTPLKEQTWKEYLLSLLGFSLVSLLFVSLLLSFQFFLPLNPQKFGSLSWDLNFNTAMSFMTNTNWQSYGGESTLSYFSQMAALTVQNFVSGAVGLAAAATLVRGIARQGASTVGNFWTDLVRITLYLLLPICIVSATIFIASGVPQNFKTYVKVETLEGGAQTIAQGPIASQEAIKLLGSNGGGFMNTNSAHPYENPSPLSNFLQLILIFLIPAAQIYYYGHSVRNLRHGWCVIGALATLVFIGFLCCYTCEAKGNPAFKELGIVGGNLEGKEQRFGIFGSTIYASVTTAVSCGAVNAMHDSFTPIGGLIPMLNIQLSEVIFGGIGAGLYSVLLFIFLAVFISGLIIGRTPEYLGKKIEAFDMKMVMLAILPFVLIVHGFSALACFTEWGLKGLGNGGAHGFSEILYAFSSATANNGSAFAGLSANTTGYNLSLAFSMGLGRFLLIAPVLALAGSFAKKKAHPINSGSFPVSSFIFISLLVGVILLLGALTFLPALTMGPIIEQFDLLKGVTFP